ncbi:hypothetical protein TNCV_3274961 [Trichonephila clavipes]|uniref:Uncharacterized protein n=1 Tax=Trichonephila clavipes TaxID=2585209 RepID=A0A8X6VN84_TRICX|nr:hypothetical protein TNCV_3274961 [Trichonephila clavipes]
MHRYDAKNGNTKQISVHMREKGIENFKIELIKHGRKELRIEEQKEIEDISKKLIINQLRASTHNREKTRYLEKKRAVRGDVIIDINLTLNKKQKKRQRNKMKEKRKNPEYIKLERQKNIIIEKKDQSNKEPSQRLKGEESLMIR